VISCILCNPTTHKSGKIAPGGKKERKEKKKRRKKEKKKKKNPSVKEATCVGMEIVFIVGNDRQLTVVQFVSRNLFQFLEKLQEFWLQP
jgi:hypothetical protein